MRVGVLQLRSVLGSVKGNQERLLDSLPFFYGKDVSLVVLPEMFLTGYIVGDLLLRPSLQDEIQKSLIYIASITKVPLILGLPSPNKRGYGKVLCNSAVLLLPSSEPPFFFYHKRLLPNYDIFDESRYFEAGAQDESSLCPTWSKEKAGLDLFEISICEDLLAPVTYAESFYHNQNKASTDASRKCTLINLAASPYEFGKYDRRENFLKNWAKTQARSVIYVNTVGCQEGIVFDGSSCVINSYGEVLGSGCRFEEDMFVIDMDGQASQYCAPLTYPSLISPGKMEDVFCALVTGLKDYWQVYTPERLWVGLSGGIDSSLVAVLCVHALGADRVCGVSLPSKYTSDDSIRFAENIAENLGIELKTFSIWPLYETLSNTLGLDDVYKVNSEIGFAKENIQSRARAMILMALSNMHGGVVVGTSNKSEVAVGYATLYGDTIGALHPIADVWKTDVYKLAEEINRNYGPLIPEGVLLRAPSAELRPGQVDSDSLPPYEELDPLLKAFIEDNMSLQTLREQFGKSLVDMIVERVSKNQFKRYQAPPSIRISSTSLSTRSWRYPIFGPPPHVL